MFLFFYLIGFLVIFVHSSERHWNYRDLGPDVWKYLYPTCGFKSQSPIDIKTGCTAYKSFSPFVFSTDYNRLQSFTLSNNGHTISGEQIDKIQYNLTLEGGDLNETFYFKNFHLHWGENFRSGSEHQLNGQKFSGEIHFVHTNKDATRIAVLAIFMQSDVPRSLTQNETVEHRQIKSTIYKTDNSTLVAWQEYFQKAEELENVTDRTTMNLTLLTLMGKNLDKFYRYSGSLTTPPCTENVIWTIFETPIDFTEIELESFRTHIFYEDFRGPQFLHERTVHRNFPNATLSSIADYACCIPKSNGTENIPSSVDQLRASINKKFNHVFFAVYLFLNYIF